MSGAMNGVTQIRDAIAGLIEGVEEAGHVHVFERYARDDRAIFRFFAWPGNDPERDHLRGWQIRLQSSAETVRTYPETSLVTHRWRIIALMSVVDSWRSGVVFDEMIERVRAAYRRDRSLGGLLSSGRDENLNGLQLVDNGASLVAGRLCHVAELRLETAVELDGTPGTAFDDYLTTETVFSLPALPEDQRLPLAEDRQDMREEIT